MRAIALAAASATYGDRSLRAAMIKRAIDILGSLLAILLLGWLMVLIAVLVRLGSRGPAVFRQRRAGRGGRPFTLYKFRTMRQDADPYAPSPRSEADARLTRLGKLLRRTSLDELPQFFNVLKGDMSLVGPRPLYERQAAEWNARQRRRLEVRPGVTGLAQTGGRAQLTLEEKLEMDVRYDEKQSLLLDLRIIMRTIGMAFSSPAQTYERRYSRDKERETD
jgi:lipopolysaccharide/colanic/teichoic acid biosynthesis glycosyltransferase